MSRESTTATTHEFRQSSHNTAEACGFIYPDLVYCGQPRDAAIHQTSDTAAEPPNRFAQARKLLDDEYSFRPKDDEELVGFLVDRLRQVEAALTEVDNVVWKIQDSIAKVT